MLQDEADENIWYFNWEPRQWQQDVTNERASGEWLTAEFEPFLPIFALKTKLGWVEDYTSP